MSRHKPVYVGQDVKFQSSTGPRIFHGRVVSILAKGYYCAVDDGTGMPPRIVRAERLLPDLMLTAPVSVKLA